MKKYLYLFLFFIGNVAISQVNYQLPQSVFAVAGGYATNENYVMNWTIGDVLIFSESNANYAITNGFEQPMICKTIPIITASNVITCSQPYALKVSSGFNYYRWKLDASLIANERDSIYLPVTNAIYSATIGDSTGCYLNTPTFETDFSLKKSKSNILVSTFEGRDTLLTSTEGISYQWYITTPKDRISRAIQNANKQFFRPYYNGEYFVKVHFDDYCVAQSPSYIVNNVGQEILESDAYLINDSTIFFKYNQSKNYRLQLYPNPCKKYFTIDYESPLENNLLLSVYDVLGKEMEMREINKTSAKLKKQFNVNWLPGFYIVKINDGSQTVFQNLIVQ